MCVINRLADLCSLAQVKFARPGDLTATVDEIRPGSLEKYEVSTRFFNITQNDVGFDYITHYPVHTNDSLRIASSSVSAFIKSASGDLKDIWQ